MRFRTFIETPDIDDNGLLMQLRQMQIPIPWNWDSWTPMQKQMHVYFAVQQKARHNQAVDKARGGETQGYGPAPTPPPVTDNRWAGWLKGLMNK